MITKINIFIQRCHPLSPQGMVPNQVSQTLQEAIPQAPPGKFQVYCQAGALFFTIMILFSGRARRKIEVRSTEFIGE